MFNMYPIILDYTGNEAPEHLDGRSLRPLLSDPSSTSDKPAISQVFHSPNAQVFSICTPSCRCTGWMHEKAGVELYDHKTDLDEVMNLANDPRHAETVRQLNAKLKPYNILQKSCW